MAYSNIHSIQSFKAGAADLAYGTAVKLDTSKTDEATVIQATSAADDVTGFVFNPVYVEGQTVGIQMSHKCEVVAGGAVAIGEYVAPTTGGRLVKASTGKYVGQAVTAAANAGDYFTILIKKGTLA